MNYKDKKWLNDQYWDENKSMRDIAKECEGLLKFNKETSEYYYKKNKGGV